MNNKYNWSTHIKSLLPSLYSKLNIIKCLACHKFKCNTLTLLNIAKAAVIVKIEYGLFLYGQSPRSTLNKLKTPHNAAIRTALGAFRSTPIHNLLHEANIPSIELKRDLQIAKLSKNLINSINTPLHKFVKSPKNKKKNIPVIDHTINMCRELAIPYKPHKPFKYKLPHDLTNLIDTGNISKTL